MHKQGMKFVYLLKRGIFLIIPFGLVFLILEGLFRLAGYAPLKIYQYTKDTPSAYFFISDQRLGFKNRPNGSYVHHAVKGSPHITTDQFGYRNGIGWENKPDVPMIVFIGDSTTFCPQVSDDNTITSEVAKLLSPDGKFQVLNAGVMAYNTVQAKRMLEQCLQQFSNIKIVVYTYCENDYAHNINPLYYFPPIKSPFVEWNPTHTAIHEIEVSSPVVPWGETFFVYKNGVGLIPKGEGWYLFHIPKPSLRRNITNSIRSKSAFLHQVGLRLKMLSNSYNAASLNSDTPQIKHAAASYRGIQSVDASNPQQVSEQNRWAKELGTDEMLSLLLSQMNELCRAKRITFLTTEFTRGEPSLVTDFSKIANRAGVHFIDIRPYFTDNPLSYAVRMNNGTYDGHYGQQGTKTFARAISPTLRELLLNE
ncbi:hypothetical protein U14_01787 [Candidatus Moduliflexus flocculans]|uniref:SGNH/GDSL hydrolase family protein n=1 Tax=Candidatus Moduliflexus flocculans TaxID=1499966 RepID=A0A0S6VXD4_9BACT|nr:hypothetical protein U14_01787 [Candidatus Moduliflexus flocculans]